MPLRTSDKNSMFAGLTMPPLSNFTLYFPENMVSDHYAVLLGPLPLPPISTCLGLRISLE